MRHLRIALLLLAGSTHNAAETLAHAAARTPEPEHGCGQNQNYDNGYTFHRKSSNCYIESLLGERISSP